MFDRRTVLSLICGSIVSVGGCLGTNRIVWRRDIGKASGITVSDGVAYLGVDTGVQALDIESGELRWEHTDTTREIRRPVVGTDRVYVTESSPPRLAALSDGDQKWEYREREGIFSRPAVSGKTVYLTRLGVLYALDSTDGSVQARVQFGGDGSPTPVVTDRRIYVVGGDDDTLIAFDRSTYRRVWTHPVTDRQVCVGENRVFVPSKSHGLAALDPADGTVRWESGVFLSGPPRLTSGTIYGHTTGGRTVSYTTDGTERWTVVTGRHHGPLEPGSDAVYIVRREPPQLYAVEAASGDQDWRLDLSEPPTHRPTNTEKYVLVPTTEGVIAVRK